MPFRDKPDDLATAAEEYELGDNPQDHDPLLPRYEAEQRSVSPIKRRPSRRRRPFVWICLTLIILTIGAGAGVCFAAPSKVPSWDSLPQSLKDWINKALPNAEEALKDDANFPTNVGYPGPTPTGSEAALLATATRLPMYSGVAPLVPPPASTGKSFNIMQHWGNLSPYHTANHGLDDSSALIPEGCELDEMHWLQRHGARYPTSNPHGPAGFAQRVLKAKNWKASGQLDFLNNWTYMLGAELLTPFGRSQLYNLGVAARVHYGFLLDRFEDRLPVLRTTSQDRMLHSALNWAAGFFGIPAESQHHLEIIIEAPRFNNSLAPYHTCPNDAKTYEPLYEKLAVWDSTFLKHARKRLQAMIKGYDLSFTDVKEMMDTCAYETVALGHSAFCDLFTEKEWKGYSYRSDIYWWYAASFGSPVARAEAVGWVQEMTARLTHTPLTTFNSAVNGTLHDPIHFPLNDALYADFTHDTTFAQLLPTMNLTSFSTAGPPPLDHIPKDWTFHSNKFCPFATNLQVQVLTCSNRAAKPAKVESESILSDWWPFDDDKDKDKEDGDDSERRRAKRDDEDDTETEAEKPATNESTRQIRLILNDAPVPLTGINGCKEDSDGMCDFDAFVASMHTLIGEVDFDYDCNGDYEFDLDNVVNGRPGRR